jgi:hypothetical protein
MYNKSPRKIIILINHSIIRIIFISAQHMSLEYAIKDNDDGYLDYEEKKFVQLT